MPIKIMDRYTREIIHKNPDWLFVFGDNVERQGFGGQAGEARGEPNAVGVATKWIPTNGERAFFTDKEYSLNIPFIIKDFRLVLMQLQEGGIVVWPADGIGTGLAMLPEKAPHTLHFINNLVNSLKAIYGEV